MRRRGRPPHPDVLTPREWEVLGLLRRGASNEEIASQLGVTLATAKFHVSEIISKLGVGDRHEAARWRPSRRGVFAPAPLGWLLSSSAPAHALGGAVIVVAVVAVGLLAWGVFTQRSHDAAGTTDGVIVAEHMSVLAFDTRAGEVQRLNLGRNLAFAQWVDDHGIIAGYDGDEHAYVAVRTDGSLVQTIYDDLPDDGTIDRWLAPHHDDRHVTVYWEGRDAFSVVDVLTGTWTNFTHVVGVNSSPQFSLNGSRMAYVNWQNTHLDERAEFVQERGYSLIEREGLVFGTAFGNEVTLELAPNAWSPDSRYVLGIETRISTGRREQTYRVYDLELTNSYVWSQTFDPLTSVMWAGPNRLFISSSNPRFVDVGTGEETPAGPAAPGPTCCISFSPDGRYVVLRTGRGVASELTCGLFETETWTEVTSIRATTADENTAFCATVNWTEDSATALVSAGGN